MNPLNPPETPNRQAAGGLLVRRMCWALSLRGKLLCVLLLLAAILLTAERLYPFLAMTDRTPGELLVVEGWIPSQSIGQILHEQEAGPYRNIVIVTAVYPDGNKWDSGRYKSEYLAGELVRRGVPQERVHEIFCDVVRKDRTYESAQAVKKWIHDQGLTVAALNVVTIGPHARRSRLLYRKSFGQDIQVGVIPLEEWAYDPACWWCSSEGVRDVLFESIAYAYVRLFFRPS